MENQLHFNIPTGATFEFSINDVAEYVASATDFDFSANTVSNIGNASNDIGSFGYRAVDGSATTPSFSFTSDTNTGIFWDQADVFSFTAGGTRTMSVINGSVGIGTTNPAATALLDITSTTKGFLPSRMTTTQRDAITSPATGLLIYNSSTNALNVFDSSVWAAVGGTSFPLLATGGSQSAPSFSFSGDTDSGLFREQADVISLGVGNTAPSKISVALAGVGIGTTNPSTTLDVVGTFRATNGTRILKRVSTAQTATTRATSDTTINGASFTVPANLLSTNRGLRWTAVVTTTAVGAIDNVRLIVDFGGTNILATAGGNVETSRGVLYLGGTLYNRAIATSQFGTGSFYFSNSSPSLTAANGTAAIDTSANVTFALQCLDVDAGAGGDDDTATLQMLILEELGTD